jgi:hypothetical protein
VLRLQARTTTSGQTYFFINILYSTGSPLQQQSWMTVTDTVWSVPPKNIYSLALYRESLPIFVVSLLNFIQNQIRKVRIIQRTWMTCLFLIEQTVMLFWNGDKCYVIRHSKLSVHCCEVL